MVSNNYSNKKGGTRRVSNKTTAGKLNYGNLGGTGSGEVAKETKHGFGGIKRRK